MLVFLVSHRRFGDSPPLVYHLFNFIFTRILYTEWGRFGVCFNILCEGNSKLHYRLNSQVARIYFSLT